jgi:hypothetical protein
MEPNIARIKRESCLSAGTGMWKKFTLFFCDVRQRIR